MGHVNIYLAPHTHYGDVYKETAIKKLALNAK